MVASFNARIANNLLALDTFPGLLLIAIFVMLPSKNMIL